MKTIISDVADCVLKRISDNKIVFTAEAQLSSISQKINSQDVRGGIGSRLISILKSEKDIELTVRNAVFDSDYLEMVSGTSFESKTNTVFKKEENLLSSKGTSVKIKGTPAESAIIKVIAADGTQYAGTFTANTGENAVGGTVAFTGGTSGAYYTCLYQASVTGNTLSIEADKFSEKYYCEFSTIEYDYETNAVKADLIWVFDSVLPIDDFDLSFENNKPITPEVKLRCLMNPGSSIIGKVIEVSRN
jgi:hypothetical protein